MSNTLQAYGFLPWAAWPLISADDASSAHAPAVNAEDARDLPMIASGDEAALRRLIERYQRYVYQQMWRFTRDPIILEELVQEVFVQVYYSLPKYRATAPLLPWIRAISTRTGYRHWTREKRRRRNSEAGAAWAARGACVAAPSPAEAGEELFHLLALLSPKDRLVLTLYYLEELSAPEIAARMGWSATLVRVRVHRALKKLQGHLQREGAQHE